jgi:hypothetical protein
MQKRLSKQARSDEVSLIGKSFGKEAPPLGVRLAKAQGGLSAGCDDERKGIAWNRWQGRANSLQAARFGAAIVRTRLFASSRT